jgi:hypothetical protein
MTTHSLEFITEFASRGALGTINGKNPLGIYKLRPGKFIFQFSSVKNCLKLYKIHQILSLMFQNEQRIPPPQTPDECVTNLVESMTKDLRYQVATKILWFDSQANLYRMTLKGAAKGFVMLIPPMLQFRRSFRTKKNKALVRRLEAESSVAALGETPDH